MRSLGKEEKRKDERARVNPKREEGRDPFPREGVLRGRLDIKAKTLSAFLDTLCAEQKEPTTDDRVLRLHKTKADAGIAHSRRRQGRRGIVSQALATLSEGSLQAFHPSLTRFVEEKKPITRGILQQKNGCRSAHVLASQSRGVSDLNPTLATTKAQCLIYRLVRVTCHPGRRDEYK